MAKIKKYAEYITENYESNTFYHGSPHVFDKFDMSKVGTGDGKSKFGYGLYFSDSYQAASYYAKELSVGNHRTTGFNMYEVKLKHANNYLKWESEMPDYVYSEIFDNLVMMNFTDQADQIEHDTSEENGYSMWSVRSFYEYLESFLGSKKATTEFLYECGVYGVKERDVHNGGTIYVAYSDKDVEILEVSKLTVHPQN
jgi:hypothetical protein